MQPDIEKYPAFLLPQIISFLWSLQDLCCFCNIVDYGIENESA